jgi:hypothetical protein
MTLRFCVAVVGALLVVLAGAAVLDMGPLPPLRSEHSEPASVMPAGQVAVTDEGKTFHKADCPYIHGPAKMVDAGLAVSEGYTPCVRCEREALGR